MLDLIVESVTQAAANPLAVFCFCNLLIVIILMSPKPSSNFHETSEFHLTVVTHDRVMDKQRTDMEQPPEDEETSLVVMELCVDGNLEKEGGSYNSEGQDGEVMELCVDGNLEKEGGSYNSEGQDAEVMELCVDGNLEKKGGSYNSEGQDGEVMELCVDGNLEKEGGSYNNEGQDGEVMELCVFENLEKEGGSCNSEGEDGDKDDGESNNEDDDEFRRRIEAFIDKVKRERKAENLRTLYLCEQEQMDLLVSY